MRSWRTGNPIREWRVSRHRKNGEESSGVTQPVLAHMWGPPPPPSSRAQRGSPEPLLSISHLQSSANNLKISPQNNIDGLRISNMLLLQNAASQSMFVVAARHRNSLLHDDRSMIKFFIHKMHGAARDLYPISEGLLLCFKPGESWQQRGMNVKNLPRELLHKPGREQPHVSRQADQVHIMPLEHAHNFAVVLFPRPALRWNHHRIQSALPCRSDARSVRAIGDNNSNSRIRDAPHVDAVGDGHKVRPAPGKKNAERMH